MAKNLRLLFFGDLVGRPGCMMLQKWAGQLKSKYKADGIIVNAENSADNGRGITRKVVDLLVASGVNAITTGNHIWGQKDTPSFIDTCSNVLIRPANYPPNCPGKGYTVIDINGITVAIVNMQGRVFMHEHLDCPFRAIDTLLTFLRTKTNIIFVDFHAETTSEKQGFSYYVDGRVSGVFGTHTHVQTADEKILPGGTAFITDLGFSGALYSMLGMKKETILKRLITQMPSQFMVETSGPFITTGICVEVDTTTGKAVSIERIKVIDEDLQV